MKKWSISASKIYSKGKDFAGNILINNGKIEKVSQDTAAQISVDISDGIVSPGLINSHDHLLGTYYPKIGKGPYESWLPWDNDLKSSPLYQERCQIESRDLYLLGAYRNLVSGVTTVSDHIPHFVGDPFYGILPVKAIEKFSLAHSIGPYALAWGDGINEEYRKSIKGNMPFITHISEGFDKDTKRNLMTLEKEGGLGELSVLVHGIAFSESDMDLIKARDASVVWCADSNLFMFNATTNIKMLLDKDINVCIGTDSPASGGLNLLLEIKICRQYYREKYGKELKNETIVRMITSNPAKAFRLPENGRIEDGAAADITVFRDRGRGAAASIVDAGLEDIMLVVIDGRPVYADSEFSELFDVLGADYQEITLKDSPKIVTGDLKGLLTRISRAVGFKKEFPFLPVDFDI